ncbi:NAD-binding protein [Fomitiporia mediterranea MF3/22]|uniref:NAD-binding protein n=1 Tax=Fomitiporia mediterranea (strain MF3/22) TaxID=694068 RepID=UPI00044096D0|nr:NAD-binding protein [Fomitiporia mediterranea MF3/22]EJD08561.1 NAD-binding protein [Fomitiporia mediterranea MF3/22]
MKQVFFLGATGYIGGSLLVALIKEHPEFHYVTLVRSATSEEAVRAISATVISGSFTDFERITELSEQSDIIINAADSDNIELTVAILKGMKSRYTKGNGVGILLHTSGTCNFLGEKPLSGDPRTTAWTDSEMDVKLINPSMLHGQVDTLILEAGQEGYMNSYIICPSMVHGQCSGPVPRTPALVKMLVSWMLERNYAFCSGSPTTCSGLINMEDLIPVYLIVFQCALQTGSSLSKMSPYARYYIATGEEMTCMDTFVLVAEALHDKGKLESSELNRVSPEELSLVGSISTLGMHVCCEHLLEMGWNPGAPSFRQTVANDVDSVLTELHL